MNKTSVALQLEKIKDEAFRRGKDIGEALGEQRGKNAPATVIEMAPTVSVDLKDIGNAVEGSMHVFAKVLAQSAEAAEKSHALATQSVTDQGEKSVLVLRELIGVLNRYDEQSSAMLDAIASYSDMLKQFTDVVSEQNAILMRQTKATEVAAKAEVERTTAFKSERTIVFKGDKATISGV